MIKAVLFDLGDTVIENKAIDLGKGLVATLKPVLNHPNFAPIINDMIAYLNQRNDLEYQIDEFFARIEKECDYKCPEDIEEQLFIASCDDQLMDGIISCLQALKADNYITGIVSNSLFHQEVLKCELDKLGIGTYFDFIIASANAKYRKSSPIIFECAYQELLKIKPDLKKEEVLFIGDNLEFDYQSPLAFGFNALWFNRDHQEGNALSIDKMADLIPYIKGLK